MAKAALTLSPIGASGSTVYNSYYFFTQLSALYAVGFETETSPLQKKQWQSLSDGSLDDVGKLFSIWEWTLGQIKAGTMKPEVSSEWEKIALACKRMAVIHRLTNLWTPRVKWARICYVCEYRWQKIIEGFRLQSEELGQLAASLYETSVTRQKMLVELIKQGERQENLTNMWFGSDDGFLEHDKGSAATPPKDQPVTQQKLKIVGNT